MKHLFFALFSLIFLAGCGKKEAETQDQAKASAKPVAPVSKQEPPKTSPKTTAEKPGTVLWEFGTGGRVWPSPAIGPDGTVYVGSYDKKLYAINPKSGLKLWEFETGDRVFSSPAIGPDGTVYVGSYDKKLYAINPKSGLKLWEFETGDEVFSSPAIGSDGTVYVGSSYGNLKREVM